MRIGLSVPLFVLALLWVYPVMVSALDGEWIEALVCGVMLGTLIVGGLAILEGWGA